MLKIGEFAEIAGISINMLRNYDKMGVLVPEVVDKRSGYRYYSESQVAQAHRIKLYKELGFGLKEIPRLNAFSDTEVRFMISQKILEKQALVSKLQEEIKEMKQSQENYELYAQHDFEIHTTVMKPRMVATLCENVRDPSEEKRLIQRLERECLKAGMIRDESECLCAVTHSADFVYGIYNIEVQFPVVSEENFPEDKGFGFKKYPPVEVAVATFDGTPEQVGQVNRYVRKFVQSIGYAVLGAPLRRIGGSDAVYYYEVRKLDEIDD